MRACVLMAVHPQSGERPHVFCVPLCQRYIVGCSVAILAQADEFPQNPASSSQCMYVCMYVMYVMYVCMYVCMYVMYVM